MRRTALYLIIIFQILLIISLAKGIQQSRRSSLRIKSLEQTKQKLLAEQESLKKESKYVESDYYLEKVARDELNLAKPGETVVIIPEGLNQELETRNQELGSSEEKVKPNWQKWLAVLSGKI